MLPVNPPSKYSFFAMPRELYNFKIKTILYHSLSLEKGSRSVIYCCKIRQYKSKDPKRVGNVYDFNNSQTQNSVIKV